MSLCHSVIVGWVWSVTYVTCWGVDMGGVGVGRFWCGRETPAGQETVTMTTATTAGDGLVTALQLSRAAADINGTDVWQEFGKAAVRFMTRDQFAEVAEWLAAELIRKGGE